MIFYATKQTLRRYKLKTPEQYEGEKAELARWVIEKESGNRLFEWGCKLFYLDGKKCLQIMHFETKLVLFLMDLKMKDLEFVGDAFSYYLLDMYAEDKVMQQALQNYFAAAPMICYDRITDKSIISSMNGVQLRWACDGYAFYGYIRDGILHTREANRDVNDMPQTRKVNGKEEWVIPYKLFAQTIKKYFGVTKRSKSSYLS